MLSIPVLYGVPIDKNSIRWYWELDGNSHAIYDSNGDIIAQIASNISEYVEIGLTENTSYERRLKAFNSNEESNFSNKCLVTTYSNQNIISNILPFSDDFNNTFNIINDEIVGVPLRAFTTGVGDKFDLKVTKQGVEDYNNTFNLIGKIYGKYHKNITSFQRVRFNYRVKAIGKYEKETCQGYVKLKLSATTTDKIKVRVYRYATKPMDIKVKIQCKVSYYEKNGSSWMPKTKTLSSMEYKSTLQASVSYTEKGNAVLDVKNNVLVNSDAIGTTMFNIAMQDPIIKQSYDSNMGVILFEYKIYDDYAFNTSDNRYSPNKARPFDLAQYGTIQAHTSSSSVVSTNSGIYMSGYSEGQLFDCEKIFEKSITGNNNEVVVISKSDIDNLIPKCISDRSYAFDGSNTSIVTKIEILEIGSTITIVSNNINSDKVLSVCANTFYETPILNYSFNDITKNHYISTENIFSNMLKDYTVNYSYILNIIDCTSNIILNGETSLTPNYTLSWIDDYMSGFSLEAKESNVVLQWEYAYPEYPNEGLNGIVNAINSLDGSYMKKDLLVQLPEVYVPQEMFDVKFQLIAENISPENSHLTYNFLNADNDGYTTINGDFALFSSDATKPEIKEIKDLLKVENLSTITLNDTTTKQMIVNIAKPILTDAQKDLYESLHLTLKTDSNDIKIFNYNEELTFDESESNSVSFKCKVFRNSTSKWHPYIHNGFYYLNQDEYYLYSQSNISGDYTDNYEYIVKDVSYKINVTIGDNGDRNDRYDYLYSNIQDYNIQDKSLVEFKDGYLLPKPSNETCYYKEYRNIEHIVGEVSLPKKATSYNPLTYELSKELNQIRLLGRSVCEDGNWSEWFVLDNGSVPKFPKSYKVQFMLEFEPNVDNIEDNIVETLSDLNEFNNDIDHELSRNIILSNGIIESNSKEETSIYFSKVFNYKNKTMFSLDLYSTCANTNYSNYINIHIASSDDENDITYSPNWVLADSTTQVEGKYIRYRIEFTKNIKIIALYKHIKTLKTISEPQGVNNIFFSANTSTEEIDDKIISIDRLAKVKYNKEDHIATTSIRDVIHPIIKSYGFNDTDINDINVVVNDDDFELDIRDNTIDFEKQMISEVFGNWQRISNLGDSYPSISSELNNWTFDNQKSEIHYGYKSKSYVGMISPQTFSDWQIKATLNSNDYSNNHISFILAYEKDSYGKEYTLSLLISPGSDSYKVVYNYMQSNEKLIIDCKDKVINNTDIMYWSQLDYGIRIEVNRNNNIFSIKRSQENQPNIDDNTLVELNIDQYPQLSIFRKSSSIGFGSCNVRSIFSNLLLTTCDIANSSICIKSKSIKVNHKDGEHLNVVDNEIKISPFPQQYSPIILLTDKGDYLKRVYYKNEKGEYSLDIKEEYYKSINNTYVLTEKNIDIDSLDVYINNEKIVNYALNGNVVTIYDQCSDDDIVRILYRIDNSFVANYNYHSDEVCINIHTKYEVFSVIVKYETNLVDNRKEIKNISLNPIYNTECKGFLYISYEDNVIDKINIHCNPKSVLSNGVDAISLYFEAVDNIGNPVEGVELSSYCISGSLIVTNNVTDENGIVTARYVSTNKPTVDTISVYNSSYCVESKININNIEVI